MQENMELAVPKISTALVVAAPVDVAPETVHQFEPCHSARGAGAAGMRVHPVLKRVHGGDPGENSNDALEMRAAGAIGIAAGIEFLEEFIAQKFHAHRGHFAELDRRAAIRV